MKDEAQTGEKPLEERARELEAFFKELVLDELQYHRTRRKAEVERWIVTVVDRALDLARQEERRRWQEMLKPCLDYCKHQNGLPYCKNCGLSREMIQE